MKLHLGCGTLYKEGWVNADISPALRTDVCFDADDPATPWPFQDNKFDEVYSFHMMEHCRNFLWVVGELHRVCKNGAIVNIHVPYLTSTVYNLVNPYHHTYFTEHTFWFFEYGKLKGSANELNKIEFQTKKVNYQYFPEWKNKTIEEQAMARRKYLNVVESLHFELRVRK